MKTLLIITGPQGSGNHLFSKIFATHPSVTGWKNLLDTYWIGHDEEPMAAFWKQPETILSQVWADGFYVTSISNPYFDDGVETSPNYEDVIRNFRLAGFRVKVGIIGRDQNILRFQQKRVRGKETLDVFLSNLPTLLDYKPIFLSTELLYLYRSDYVHSLQLALSLPVLNNQDEIEQILQSDPNAKYFSPVGHQPLDDKIHHASKPKKNR